MRLTYGRAACALLATLCAVGTAQAGPITSGYWVPTPAPTEDANKSEDDTCAEGPRKCAGVWMLPAGTESLVGGFGYEGWKDATHLGGITEYVGAPGLSYNGNSFTYDNGRGFASNSWGGQHQKLYRKLSPKFWRFWLLIEDLQDPIVWDWNDDKWTWLEATTEEPPQEPEYPYEPPVLPPPVDNPPAAIPEPGTLLLLGSGLLIAARRRWQAGCLGVLLTTAISATPATAAPIVPEFGAAFQANGFGWKAHNGRLDALVTFDRPLTGTLTITHVNEDDWPLDGSDGAPRWLMNTWQHPGLTVRQTAFMVENLTWLGFARFVVPDPAPLNIGGFDYVPRPLTVPQPVPEPATLTMLGVGLLAAARRWRRKEGV